MQKDGSDTLHQFARDFYSGFEGWLATAGGVVSWIMAIIAGITETDAWLQLVFYALGMIALLLGAYRAYSRPYTALLERKKQDTEPLLLIEPWQGEQYRFELSNLRKIGELREHNGRDLSALSAIDDILLPIGDTNILERCAALSKKLNESVDERTAEIERLAKERIPSARLTIQILLRNGAVPLMEILGAKCCISPQTHFQFKWEGAYTTDGRELTKVQMYSGNELKVLLRFEVIPIPEHEDWGFSMNVGEILTSSTNMNNVSASIAVTVVSNPPGPRKFPMALSISLRPLAWEYVRYWDQQHLELAQSARAQKSGAMSDKTKNSWWKRLFRRNE